MKRETVVLSIRVDKRIVKQLNLLAKDQPQSRNFLIEQILGRECGLPYYEWTNPTPDAENVCTCDRDNIPSRMAARE